MSNPGTCSVYAMNGKSVEIDFDTDADGLLVLSGKIISLIATTDVLNIGV